MAGTVYQAPYIHICVVRNAGDKPADDIVEALLTSEVAAVERGRQELNARAHAMQEVDLGVRYRDGTRIGQLVSVVDSVQGKTYKGRHKSIAHTITNTKDPVTGLGEISVVTSIGIERPTNFYE